MLVRIGFSLLPIFHAPQKIPNKKAQSQTTSGFFSFMASYVTTFLTWHVLPAICQTTYG
jgi:hypothetical protein